MFCHLHVHTQYSLLQSSIKTEDLVEKASMLGMKSIAITDMSVLHGAFDFFKKAEAKSIKPLIGIEASVRHQGMDSNFILIAKNSEGYKNLCRISSFSNLKFYGCPCPVDLYFLSENSKGIIALYEFYSNGFAQLLEKNMSEEALKKADEARRIFKDDFYMEIQRHPGEIKKTVPETEYEKTYREQMIISFAQRSGIKLAASNGVCFLEKKDFSAYKALEKINLMGSRDKRIKPLIIQSQHHYLKNEKEMREIFLDIPDSIENTNEISEKCSFSFGPKKIIMPKFKILGDYTQYSYLRKLCFEKISLRYGASPSDHVLKRLEHELGIIKKTGFCGYFLIASDIADFASKNNIATCGKGSAAGSIVTYILGISNVDPVKQNLYFERFLNSERKSPPDIDMDMSSRGRFRVVDYLCKKYGKNNVLRVPVFTEFKTRSSIREAGRVLSIGKQEIEGIIGSPGELCRYRPSTSGLINKDIHNETENKIIEVSEKIKNNIRHISMHPCAFIIFPQDSFYELPLMISETGETMSQYSAKSVEDMGFLKLDIINSVTLDHIEETREILKKTRNIEIDFSGLDYKDGRVYKMLAEGRTMCTFQLESMGIRALMKKLKPSSLNDITLLISLYRPGPQQSGMVDIFIERKFNNKKTDYLHEDLREMLEETLGVMLYQEQVMKVSIKIAGYSFKNADSLRKAISDLSPSAMEAEREKFIRGALEKGYDIIFAKKIFNLVSKFAGYGFVKAHAAAYAEIGYKTCLLKDRYPAELISLILTKNSGYYSSGSYVEEARRLSIKIKLPDVNISSNIYSAEDDGASIRISLLSISDLGFAGVKAIIDEREKNGPFPSFTDFFERIIKIRKITIKAAENLIKIGAFDFTGLKRKYLLVLLKYLAEIRRKKYEIKNATLFIKNEAFFAEDMIFSEIIKSIDDYDFYEKLELESSILSYCASASPLDYFDIELKRFKITDSSCFADRVNEKKHVEKNIYTAGIVLIKRKEKSKSLKEILFITLEDKGGMYEAVFFDCKKEQEFQSLLPGTPVALKGDLVYKNGDISLSAERIINLYNFKKSQERKTSNSTKLQLLKLAVPVWNV